MAPTSRPGRDAAPGDDGHAPPRPPAFVVGADRRVELLERSLRPVTLLVAPAGAGKTATLAAWAARQRQRPAWFDGQREEDRAELRRTVEAPGAPVVVVDDAHGLSARELTRLVEAAARADVRLVLASRRDLALPVVRLELAGRLAILRGDHLRLTPAETTELIEAHAPDADADDVAAVGQRANGWAAAVVLGAHALASAADRNTARAALIATDQPVLDYLLDEVFTALPAATRHVLLCTAHEERVTAASATVLSGDPAAPALLARLAVEGMFVFRFDDASPDGPVWVYHPLLRELLGRQTAIGTPDGLLVAAAHARAAQHHSAEDRPVDALRHAVASGHENLTVDLLVRLAPRLLATGHRVAIEQALAAVPSRLRAGSRALIVVAAQERRAAGDAEAALRLVDELAALGPDADPPPALAPMVAADEARLRLWLTRTGLGETGPAVAAVRKQLEDCGADAGGAAALGDLRLDVARVAGLSADLAYGLLWEGDLAVAADQAHRATTLALAAGSALLVAAASAVTAVAELVEGRPQTANTAAHRALDTVLAAGPDAGPCPEEATLRAVIGVAAWCRLDDQAPRAALELASAALVGGYDPVGGVLVRLLAARVVSDEGDVALARRIVGAGAEPPGLPPFFRAVFELQRAQLALLAGDLVAAAEHTQALRELGWGADAQLLTASLALELDGPAAVADLLAPMLAGRTDGEPRAEAAGAAADLLDLVAAVELAGHAGQTVPSAPERLQRVLSRAAPQRMIRLLLPALSRPGLLELLRREAEAEGGDPFAAETLAALIRWHPRIEAGPAQPVGRDDAAATSQGEPPLLPLPVQRERATHQPPATTGAPVPPLTNRELDVLQRLARGDSYLDIAQTLFITQNTVKTHVASLYRKLNAGRRSEALRTAWALGMLVEVPMASPIAGDRNP